MITVDDILTTSGQHPERMAWVSPAVLQNATELAKRVNALFLLFGQSRRISGGFRDMLSNKRLENASPYSRHQTGEAADIEDHAGDFGKWCLAHPDALANCGLWAEPLHLTPVWLHVQLVPVPGGQRITQ